MTGERAPADVLAAIAVLNRPLLGAAGGRARLETPAALIDLALFERNIAHMAQACGRAGLGLRPHAKSHKCAEIARRQIAAGALGLCCAKPGELLALHAAGIDDLLLTAPVASLGKIDRLAQAAATRGRIGVAVERADLVRAYAQAAARHAARLDVVIDLDVGLNRCGVAEPAEAVALARLIAAEPTLRYRGVQAYHGGVQHIRDAAERRRANEAVGARLLAFVEALREAGLPPVIVSGGGTGSHALDGEAGIFTEVQAGSYVLMDEGYLAVDFGAGPGATFAPALRVAVTVVAHNAAGLALVDAGSKSLAVDGPPPRVFHEAVPFGRLEFYGDEFARLVPDAGGLLPIGTVVECTAPHCDPTINLHEVLHVVDGDRLVDFWPIEARGRAD